MSRKWIIYAILLGLAFTLNHFEDLSATLRYGQILTIFTVGLMAGMLVNTK